MSESPEQFAHSREAARITLDKVSSWEELNAATLQEADEKFKEATKKYWQEFAVSGTLQFDQKEGRQVLRPFTDLDGRSALGILQEAGIDTSKLTYVKPGEYLQGAINLDTGDKFGVVYEEPTYTAYFDHHAPGTTEVTSTTEIVYKTMVDLGMLERSESLDRLVKFVNDIDNRRLPPTEFLKSGKTLIGVQRALGFSNLLAYFKDHESPTEELTPEELEKYGLREAAEQQQRIVDEAMQKLEEMWWSGKIIHTSYGEVVVNENNELKVGSSAAYVKYDGIINITPGKSFAVTLKESQFREGEIRERLGDKFQGKFIRGKMWIFNEKEPLRLTLPEIIKVLQYPRRDWEEEEAWKEAGFAVEGDLNRAGKKFEKLGWWGNLGTLADERNRARLVELMRKVPRKNEVDFEEAMRYFSELGHCYDATGVFVKPPLLKEIIETIIEGDASKAREFYDKYGLKRMFEDAIKAGLKSVLSESPEEREKYRRAVIHQFFLKKYVRPLTAARSLHGDNLSREILFTDMNFSGRILSFLRMGRDKEEYEIAEDGSKIIYRFITAWGEVGDSYESDYVDDSVILAKYTELLGNTSTRDVIRKWIERYKKKKK